MAAFEYLKALRRRWIVVVVCFVLATGVGYVMSPDEPPEPQGAGYQASLTLLRPPDVDGVNLHLAAHLATGPDVLALVPSKLPEGVDPPGAGAVSASVDSEVNSLIISVTDRDEERVGLLVEAYAEATIEFLRSTQTESHDDALEAAETELESIEENIADLQRQRAQDPSDDVIEAQLETELTRYGIVFHRMQDLLSAEEPLPPLQVLGTAQVNQLDPGGINPPTDRGARALLAGGIGLVLGLALALTVDRLDTRLREREEIEEAFGLPVLSEIPKMKRRALANNALVTILRPDSAAAEAYRSLRSAITLVTHGARTSERTEGRATKDVPQVLVVTGARGDEGKSTSVANLAAAMAETGRSVLVIDCDFRKPETHLYLDPQPHSGLAGLSDGDFGEYLDQVVRSTAVPGVDLISSIKPVKHPAAVVSRLSGLIADARQQADVVLVDSSPLLATSDALDVLQYADAALVVCRVGRTKYDEASRARRTLQRAGVPLLGVVLTGTPPHRGTPYGQPSRREAVWSQLTNWARHPGPDEGPPRSAPPTDMAAEPAMAEPSPAPQPQPTWDAPPPAPVTDHALDEPAVAEVSDWDETIEMRRPVEPESMPSGRRRRSTRP